MAPGTPVRARLTTVVTVLAVVAVLVQLWGLYRTAGPPSPAGFPQADKVEHALGFAAPVAAVLLTLGLRAADAGRRLVRGSVVRVAAVFAAHAVVSELVQHAFYAGRTGDPVDVVADLVGVGLGVAGGLALLRRWRPGAAPERRSTRRTAARAGSVAP